MRDQGVVKAWGLGLEAGSNKECLYNVYLNIFFLLMKFFHENIWVLLPVMCAFKYRNLRKLQTTFRHFVGNFR